MGPDCVNRHENLLPIKMYTANHIKYARRGTLTGCLLLALAGCGGGSGGSGGGTDSALATVKSSTISTLQNTPVTGYFNATILIGRTPTYRIVANGTRGTAVVSNQAGGEFTYTPNNNATGSDFFTFKVNDGFGDSELAVVSVNILPNRVAPVALNDTATTGEDTPISINVLANDSSANGVLNPATVTLASLPAHGNADISSNGNITYTPDLDYSGADSFTYTMRDIVDNTSNVATVTITIIAVNDSPITKNDVFTVTGSSTTTLAVLANNGNGVDFDPENDPLVISAVSVPNKGGIAAINGAGDGLVYTPAANFFGAETFTYAISDGRGGTSVGSVTVNVVFRDNFNAGTSNWTTVNDGGTASSWAAVGGALQQLNGALGALSETYHKGTYAYHTAGTTLTSYRFSVDATFLGTQLAEDIGVMFRYQNNNNYYRLSMNSRYGYTRLEKKVGGVFSPLAVNAIGYSAGQLLTFTVDVSGSLIQVFVNGDPVFAANDTSLASGSVALYTQDKASFDNVLIQEAATTPTITLATPVARTVTTNSATLTAIAIATNVPAGGKVEFLLDGGQSMLDTTSPYNATFTGFAAGDHTIDAIIRDTNNLELARDTNTLVGTHGDYYVAIGDSITNGSRDYYATDNQTARILGFQGYPADVARLLEQSQVKPVMVYNEGIGGDESADAAFTRVNSILARHPGSNKALVLLGTNDALAQIPSGSGCSGAACTGTFKGNMQSLINTLTTAGKTVYVATAPPVFGSPPPFANPATATANTNYVQPYNSVISSQLTGHQQGPDFYAYFLGAGQNRYSLFADVWHPNGLGYAVIAALWHNALNPGSPAALPFVLGSLVPSTVAPYLKQNLLETGDSYYVDASYTLNGVPSVLASGRWIMTANADVGNTSSSYISFTTDRAVTVYIAYDAGATALPSWMSTFTNTGLTVGTTDSFSPILNLYSRSYSTGSITLGGNAATGASGANSNYVAIVVAN
ncbi:MAG: hemagglutinin/hemolysin-like protein [Gammaproteobacteria bacterium]|nr:MAG: hemagglutinin/hemolysin-like protein [Gammaproteobacteria bacterium]TND04524.1 MAG: hemagglutinin/hemolysin-like protein [Gammaproteobacteria bacterium]